MLQQNQILNADQSDTNLLAAFVQDGDSRAFRLLVERYQRLVFGACLRGLNRDNAAADDASQAVFILLARNASHLEGAALAGWLFKTSLRVVHTMRREALRRKKREARMAKTLDAQGGQSPVHHVDHHQRAQVLHAAIAKLPARQRDAILLYYFNGCDQAAVGARLGCSAKAVQKRIEYGLATLRSRLGKYGITGNFGVAIVALDRARSLALPAGLASRCHGAALSGAGGNVAAALRIADQVVRGTAIRTWASGVAGVAIAVAACLLIWISMPKSLPSPPPRQIPLESVSTPHSVVEPRRDTTISSPVATSRTAIQSTPSPSVAALPPVKDAERPLTSEATVAEEPPVLEKSVPREAPVRPAPVPAAPRTTMQGGGLKLRWTPARSSRSPGMPSSQPSPAEERKD